MSLPPATHSACKPILASRIKWDYQPSFDPRPFLHSPLTRAAFEDPEVLGIAAPPPRMLQPAQVHASRAEILKLAETWDAKGCLSLFPVDALRKDEAVGAFAAPKDSEYDRLINPTVVNSRMATVSEQTRTLAPGSMLCLIGLDPGEQLRFSSDDLREYYYTFVVSEARAKRNSLAMQFSSAELSHLAAFDPATHAHSRGSALALMAAP